MLIKLDIYLNIFWIKVIKWEERKIFISLILILNNLKSAWKF